MGMIMTKRSFSLSCLKQLGVVWKVAFWESFRIPNFGLCQAMTPPGNVPPKGWRFSGCFFMSIGLVAWMDLNGMIQQKSVESFRTILQTFSIYLFVCLIDFIVCLAHVAKKSEGGMSNQETNGLKTIQSWELQRVSLSLAQTSLEPLCFVVHPSVELVDGTDRDSTMTGCSLLGTTTERRGGFVPDWFFVEFLGCAKST